MQRFYALAHPVKQLAVGLDRCTWRDLFIGNLFQRRGGHQFSAVHLSIELTLGWLVGAARCRKRV